MFSYYFITSTYYRILFIFLILFLFKNVLLKIISSKKKLCVCEWRIQFVTLSGFSTILHNKIEKSICHAFVTLDVKNEKNPNKTMDFLKLLKLHISSITWRNQAMVRAKSRWKLAVVRAPMASVEAPRNSPSSWATWGTYDGLLVLPRYGTGAR